MSSSLLNSVSINKANVQDANIADLTATKLESTTANISDLTVDNLTINNVTDSTPDYDVIVIGGGISGITAAIHLAETLSSSNKKVGLFTDANKQTDLEFYKTFIYKPQNLPDSESRTNLISDFNQTGGKLGGLSNSIVGGYSYFNSNGYKNSRSNIYNIAENRKPSVLSGSFSAGGLPYSRNIGGLLTMSGGVAILDEEYYKNSDLDYLSELNLFKNMYDFLTMDDIINNNEIADETQSEIAKAMKSAVLPNSGLYYHNNGMAVEKSDYNKCGRINFQQKLDDAVNKYNLIVNYGCEVNNLNIVQKDNKNICNGIYVNGKFISSHNVILSAGIPGTTGILQTANNLTPSKPLKDFSGNFKENPYTEFLYLIPNAKDEYLNKNPNDNYTNNVVFNTVSNSKTDVYNNYTAENYYIQTFNLDFHPHLLTLATLLTGLAKGKVYTDYDDFIKSPDSIEFVETMKGIGQKTTPDASWVGGSRPTGNMMMILLICYPTANSSKLMEHSSNSCTINNEKTMHEVSNVENPFSATAPIVKYSFINGMLKYNITYEYLKFNKTVSTEERDKYLTDYKNFMIKLNFGEDSLRYNLYKNMSLGYNIDGVGLIPITSEMVDNNFPATIGSTGIPLTQTMNNETFYNAIYKCGNYTWHGTDITSNYIDKYTLEFNDIEGLYSGDQSAWPVVSPSSTGVISAVCAIRAAKSVISHLSN